MISDEEKPRLRSTHHSAYALDSGWELPELAPTLIIFSVRLLVVGSGISTGLSFDRPVRSGGGRGMVACVVCSSVDRPVHVINWSPMATLWWRSGRTPGIARTRATPPKSRWRTYGPLTAESSLGSNSVSIPPRSATCSPDRPVSPRSACQAAEPLGWR